MKNKNFRTLVLDLETPPEKIIEQRNSNEELIEWNLDSSNECISSSSANSNNIRSEEMKIVEEQIHMEFEENVSFADEENNFSFSGTDSDADYYEDCSDSEEQVYYE